MYPVRSALRIGLEVDIGSKAGLVAASGQSCGLMSVTYPPSVIDLVRVRWSVSLRPCGVSGDLLPDRPATCIVREMAIRESKYPHRAGRYGAAIQSALAPGRPLRFDIPGRRASCCYHGLRSLTHLQSDYREQTEPGQEPSRQKDASVQIGGLIAGNHGRPAHTPDFLGQGKGPSWQLSRTKISRRNCFRPECVHS